MGNVNILAHRGLHTHKPENTLPAFRLAIEQGADGIELDVQLAQDGSVVVNHDETVTRVWDGVGAIKDFTYEQLRTLHARNNAEDAEVYIPTLEQVLALCAPSSIRINIELKTSIEPYPGIVDKTMELVDRFKMTDRVLYSSFNHQSLIAIKQRDIHAPIGLLYSDILYRPWDYAKSVGADAIHPAVNSLRTPNLVCSCHQYGIAVNVWTVDDPNLMRLCAQLKVDGIITNRPDVALCVLND